MPALASPAAPVPLSPLDPRELDHAARATLALAKDTAGAAARQKEENIALRASGVRGAAILGLRRLESAALPWAAEAAQMRAVAEVLARAGALQQEIDRAAERLRGLSNNSVFLTGLARAVAALGSALDWHCAREITRLCTPVAAPPLHRLGAMSYLSLDAIHESTLAAAPQWCDLAARFPEAHFLEAGEHTVVVAFGDLDSAASVTTFVAGTGSSEAAGWPAQLERGRTIAQATGGAAVVWLGYRAPGTLPQAIAATPAKAGEEALRRFQRDLAARNPAQRRVVLGYSYGSVVVGRAASTGLLADAVVLMGSPGVPVGHASEFRLHGSQPGSRGSVHALTATGDLIDLTATRHGGVHGVDPAAPGFGATVWPTRPGDHSSYWDDPLVLRALRAIANPEGPGAPSPDAARSGSTSQPP
ncbi:alpha/beta hydrolase [Corynebacterium mastitidis]|uniref:alpha/beta hydrolase n=1 Tax=Corynebacterium mastitidis TaxID=161890 RepID=UPI0030E8C324